MDERIAEFINKLKEKLSGLSDEERIGALLYYEEYLKDAQDLGKDMDEVFKQLGTPQEIASLLQAEEYFNQAQKKPRLKSFNKAMKNAFLGVSTPVGYFVRGLFLFLVYSVLIVFLGGALVSFVAAVISFSGLLYETFKIPSVYIAERLGTLGMALFALSLLFLLSYTFFKISRWLMDLSARTIRKMLRKKIHPETYQAPQEMAGKGFNKRLVITSAIILLTSLVLTIASGLPIKLFTIFNSMKPENLRVVVNEYSASDVEKIVINTAHSHIKVLNADKETDKIVITYEQPEWLTYQAALEDGKITFKEISNGRFPLFDLVSLHESRTEVTLYLPQYYDAKGIELESKGGFVFITNVVQNIQAKTYTGHIFIDISKSGIPFNLDVKTETGELEADGVYQDGQYYKELSIHQQNASKSLNITSTRGNIVIQ